MRWLIIRLGWSAILHAGCGLLAPSGSFQVACLCGLRSLSYAFLDSFPDSWHAHQLESTKLTQLSSHSKLFPMS